VLSCRSLVLGEDEVRGILFSDEVEVGPSLTGLELASYAIHYTVAARWCTMRSAASSSSVVGSVVRYES
jgi:hypothetical protein